MGSAFVSADNHTNLLQGLERVSKIKQYGPFCWPEQRRFSPIHEEDVTNADSLS